MIVKNKKSTGSWNSCRTI